MTRHKTPAGGCASIFRKVFARAGVRRVSFTRRAKRGPSVTLMLCYLGRFRARGCRNFRSNVWGRARHSPLASRCNSVMPSSGASHCWEASHCWWALSMSGASHCRELLIVGSHRTVRRHLTVMSFPLLRASHCLEALHASYFYHTSRQCQNLWELSLL